VTSSITYGMTTEQEVRLRVLEVFCGSEGVDLTDFDDETVDAADLARGIAAIGDPIVAWVLTGKAPAPRESDEDGGDE
jgi:hypothetical protein